MLLLYSYFFKEVCKINTNNGIGNEHAVLVDYHNNKSLVNYGVSCHWWKSEATSLHCHNFYEFFIVTSGEAIHEINNECRILDKGVLQLIKPNDRHRILSSASKKSTHINVSVTADKLQKICNAVDISFDDIISKSRTEVNLSVGELDFFARNAERVSHMKLNSDENYRIIICEMIVEGMCLLYKKTTFSELDWPEWFVDTLDIIQSPKYCSCTADDVYAVAGFSPPVVIECFKKCTGKTVVEYLKSMKINKACDLLVKTNTPVIEISNIFGYTSLSHFCKIFKESTGTTPAAYRKSNSMY